MKVYTLHNGCESNLYDSEKAKAYLLSDNRTEGGTKEDADLVIFHGCTFAQSKEDETKQIIQKLLKETKKKIVVSGCFLKRYIIDDRITYVKNEDLKTHIDKEKQSWIPDTETIKQKEKEKLLPFVAISRGCYGTCTFCSIKSVKGSHKSRPVTEILSDIAERSHMDYVKLVGDETAGYGRDIGITLKILIDAVIEKFPNIKIKFGSLNAKILKKFAPEELAIFSYKNVTGNIHIPIQSASNSVLARMQRGYAIEEYENIYKTLKANGVTNISADIITGFPGEDETDHQKNIHFINKNEFAFMEVFAYQEREGTKAATYEQMDFDIRKSRAVEVIAVFLKRYSQWKNIPIEILTQQTRVFNTNIKFR